MLWVVWKLKRTLLNPDSEVSQWPILEASECKIKNN